MSERLATVARVCIIVATLDLVGQTVREGIAAAVQAPRYGQETLLETSSQTSATAGHVVITNVYGYTVASTCMRGLVTAKVGGGIVKSVVVCSGDIKPRTTVTMDLPYAPGSVTSLCKNPASPLEIVDWDRCDYTTEKWP